MFFELIRTMTNADWSIFVVTLLAYVFIALGIVKDKGKGQSAFSWFLWLILDVILFLSILDGNGKSIFMLAPSMLGSLVISTLLYLCRKRKKIILKDWEWINIFLIFVTAIVWQVSKDPNTAIAFGVTAQVLAGVELSIESWENPTPGWTTLGYLMFVASCVLSLATEGNAFTHFTVQDHLFPTMLGLQTVVDTIPLILKTFKKQ